jgi:hypothetical protein
MNRTAVLAIVEPLSFSLDKSIAWALTEGLQAGRTFALLDDSTKQSVGTLIGIVPILQPIRVLASGQSAFLLAMRGVINVSRSFKPADPLTFSLANTARETIAALYATTSSGHKRVWTIPFLVKDPQFQMSADDLSALCSYTNELNFTLWNRYPVNWTTFRLQLASNDKFMTAREMSVLGLSTGVLNINGGKIIVTPGVQPITEVPPAQMRPVGTVRTGVANAVYEGSCSTFGDGDGSGDGGSDGGGTTGGSG